MGYSRSAATPNTLWYHPKTGNYYIVLGISLDSTNGHEDEEYVSYWSLDYRQMRHRKAQEFLDGRFIPCKGSGEALFESDQERIK